MGTTSSRFLQKNIESCIGLGIDADKLMALVPGGTAALENPVQRFDGDVLVAVLDLAEALSGDPAIGFRCGLNSGHVIYSDMGYTIMRCQNLQESYRVSARYERIVQQHGVNSLEVRGDEAALTWRTYEDAPERLRLITDVAFSIVARLGVFLRITHGLAAKRMTLRHTDTRYKDLYVQMFGCPIEYGADEDMVVFDKAFLDVPLPEANPKVLGLLTARLDRDLEALENPIQDAGMVAAYIDRILGTAPVSMKHVCEIMGLSERSLRRRLKESGTSFRAILENVRRERYELLMCQPDVSQVAIAGMLGYSEQSAFSRAYKKWHGASPTKNG